MGLLLGVLAAALVMVYLSLRDRIAQLERENRVYRDEARRRLDTLERRVLEDDPPATAKVPRQSSPAPAASPVAPSAAAASPALPRAPMPPEGASRPPATPPPPPTAPSPTVSPPSTTVPPRATPPPQVASPLQAPPPEPSRPSVPGRSAADLEALIGGSWLNRLGVLVLVIALALLIGYSFTYLGPAGRVAIGLLVSAVLLGAGLAFERRERYRAYGRGLIGGGWAALYFTTYAMHGIVASRVIDSPATGSALLLAVALAMILHSLRYGSEVVTGLAFVVGFATLAVSPMTTFSLVATVPLAAMLLVVGRRRDWVRLALLGVVVTYAVYLFSDGELPDTGSAAGDFLAGQATLVVYWLMFEMFDLAGRWLGRSGTPAELEAAVFPLNTVAFVGVSTLQWLTTDASQFDRFLPLAALLFLTSAGARARLGPLAESSGARVLRGYEAAITVSAALGVLAILQRYSGHPQTVALLLEGELLVAAGLRLQRRFLRWLAAPVLLLAWLSLTPGYQVVDASAARVGMSAWSLMALVTAAVLYGNRLWVRLAAAAVLPAERFYTWAATLLVVLTLQLEAAPRWLEIGWLAFALVLLEAGLRLDLQGLRLQSYLVAALAFVVLVGTRVVPLGLPRLDLWIALGASTLLTWALALRLHVAAGSVDDQERGPARGACFLAGTVLLMGFIRQLLPADLVAPAWMAVGLLLLEVGYTARQESLRAVGHAAALAAFVRLYGVNLWSDAELAGWSHGVLTAVPMAAAAYWLAARARALDKLVGASELENLAARAWLWLQVPALVVLTLREVPEPALVAPPLWALYALVLLLVGRARGVGDLRLQGYLLLGPVVLVSLLALATEDGSVAGRVASIAAVAVALYGGRIAVHRSLVPLAAPGPRGDLDVHGTNLHSLLATGLVSSLLVAEVSGALLTVALAVQGAAIMVAGFALADRVLRLVGLCLLGLVVIKAFAYDLRNLDAVYRILSFAVLGLLLLAVSFIYTKYRHRLQKLL